MDEQILEQLSTIKAAKNLNSFVDAQKKLYDDDPYSFAKGLAETSLSNKINLEEEGSEPVVHSEAIKIQKRINSNGLYNVLDSDSIEKYKTSLKPVEKGGPIDDDEAARTFKELHDRFPNVYERTRAYANIGVNVAIAPVFSALGVSNPSLTKSIYTGLTESKKAQTQNTASINSNSVEYEASIRESMKRQIKEDGFAQALFGVMYADSGQRDNVEKAIEALVTGLRTTNASFDDFKDTIKKKFDFFEVDEGWQTWGDPTKNLAEEMVSLPFGVIEQVMPFNFTEKDKRVRVFAHKGSGWQASDFEVLKHNKAWKALYHSAMDFKSSAEIDTIFSVFERGESAMTGTVDKRSWQNLKTLSGLERAVISGSGEDTRVSLMFSDGTTKSNLSRAEFNAAMTARMVKMSEKVFSRSTLMNYGDELFLVYRGEGQSLKFHVDPQVVKKISESYLLEGEAGWMNFKQHPWLSTAAYLGDKLEGATGTAKNRLKAMQEESEKGLYEDENFMGRTGKQFIGHVQEDTETIMDWAGMGVEFLLKDKKFEPEKAEK